jgi:hypothetical protein
MATPFRYLLLTFWITTLLAVPGLSFASGPAAVTSAKAALPPKAAAPAPAVKADVPGSVTNLVKNPGMESGPQDWTTSDKAGQTVIRTGMGHGGSMVMALGGANADTSAAYQDVAIPADATQVFVQFWYSVASQEDAIETRPFDTATVVVSDPATNTVLVNVASLSNANRSNGAWAQSSPVDVTAQKGKTVRLTFFSTTDASKPTTFMFDDIELASVTTTPPAVPGAPMTASATSGNGQAVVTFAPPASDGGSAITGYVVTSNPAGGVDTNSGSPATSHVITNLANGTSYTFTVTAVNAVGSSVASAPSNPVVPALPAPVASFKAAPVAGSPLTVRFTDQSQFATSWLWNFGDGATSAEQNPSHLYASRGSFTVTLATANSTGSSSVTKSVRSFPDVTSIILLFNE